MIRKLDLAEEEFAKIVDAHLSDNQKRLRDQNLALIYEKRGDEQRALSFAKRVIRRRRDSLALQAEQIIAEQTKNDKQRLHKLVELKLRARRAKSYVDANNLSLAIARYSDDDAVRSIELEKVILSGQLNGDFYNATRAIVSLMNSGGSERELSTKNIGRLAQAYQHLFNERHEDLFDRCHKALWDVFGKTKQAENLFSLFRFSSFSWRLRGQDSKEVEYMEALRQLVSALISGQRRQIARELSYFKGRTSRLPAPQLMIQEKDKP